MKKSIIVFGIILSGIGLTAFSHLQQRSDHATTHQESMRQVIYIDNLVSSIADNPADFDLYYNVDNRYIHQVTKSDLHNASSIIELLPDEATKPIGTYEAVTVSIIDSDNNSSQKGYGDQLNIAQLQLLRSVGHSTNIHILADYKLKNTVFTDVHTRQLVYFITITPEQEAEFEGGEDALIKYLKESTKESTEHIKQSQLQAGKVSFTITKAGTISDVELTSTTGYTSVDDALIQSVREMPTNWKPARNEYGDKVDQRLVFSFGVPGC